MKVALSRTEKSLQMTPKLWILTHDKLQNLLQHSTREYIEKYEDTTQNW